ncbi:hypothetical protein EW146_g5523 [Bondarzewia mesenterica]|uniref:Cytochrome P450 n=1 Tax=Bondarzewia mesenterica TaxID=1095465 RepID=A0A4S4LRA4_9AGAM|nr:hypothetical protein EW146_g5523 [Bondarzewia mesenterica]
MDLPKEHQWKAFAEWGKRFGGIIHISVLGKHMIIVNDGDTAVEMLNKKSNIYSDRPVQVMAGELVGWNESIPMTPYGDRLRKFRTILHRAIGSRTDVKAFHDHIRGEAYRGLRRLLEQPEALIEMLGKTSNAFSLSMCYGYQIQEDNDPFVHLADVAMDGFSKAAEPGKWLVDIIPAMKYVPAWIPGVVFQRLAKRWKKDLTEMATRPYEYMKQQLANNSASPSFTSALQSKVTTPEDENVIMWAAVGLYAGGAGTMVSTMHTFFLVMTLFPEVQKQAQLEIDATVGRDRLPTLDDRLPYVEALVSEVLRWGPVAPLGIVHRLTKDDIQDGYFIPGGSIIIPNIWNMLRDPRTYKNPELFDPQRFLETDNGQSHLLIANFLTFQHRLYLFASTAFVPIIRVFDCQSLLNRIRENEDLKAEDKERQVMDVREVIQFSLNDVDCHRVLLLSHFGEKFDAHQCEDTCDNCACTVPVVEQDMTGAAINMSKLIQEVENSRSKITRTQAIDVFQNSIKKDLMTKNLNRFRLYGAGKDVRQAQTERIYSTTWRACKSSVPSKNPTTAAIQSPMQGYLGPMHRDFLYNGGTLLMKFRVQSKSNIKARHFHAKMAETDKKCILKEWKDGQTDVIVGTIAFGMGIIRASGTYSIRDSLRLPVVYRRQEMRFYPLPLPLLPVPLRNDQYHASVYRLCLSRLRTVVHPLYSSNIMDLPKEHQWKAFAEWGKRFGGIIHISVLGKHMIIVNDGDTAVEMLNKKSNIYSDRPVQVMAGELVGWNESIPMTPYGDRLRKFRTILHRAIGSRTGVKIFNDHIRREAYRGLRRLLEQPEALIEMLGKTSNAFSLSMCYGYQIQEDSDPFVHLADVAMDGFSKAAEPGKWLVDIIPAMKYVPAWIPGVVFQRLAVTWKKDLTEMATRPYEYMKQQLANNCASPSFTSTLQSKVTTPEEENVIMWAAVGLYAEVQKQAQLEIDATVGRDRLPTLDDRLPYVEALVSEVLRWGPVAPLGIVHRLTKDDIQDGYFIPEGSIIIPNIWNMLRDPRTYKNPELFDPQRFLETDNGQSYLLIANSSLSNTTVFLLLQHLSRLEGLHLADAFLYLQYATILAVFDITKVVENGMIIEPAIEYTSGTIRSVVYIDFLSLHAFTKRANPSRPKPFKCSIKPRSAEAEALIQSIPAAGF